MAVHIHDPAHQEVKIDGTGPFEMDASGIFQNFEFDHTHVRSHGEG
jgi:hypothetical protein